VTEISRVALFGKLNPIGYKAIESATVFCKLRGNPYVELVHWIHQILQLPDSDLHRIVKQFSLEPSRLAQDITDALDRLPRGSTSISDLSSHVEDAVERGWVYGSLMFKEYQVRTGYLVVGILKTPGLRNALAGISKELDKIKVETLMDRWAEIVGDSPEERMVAQDGTMACAGVAPGEASGAMAPAQMRRQEALARFTLDLTALAGKGEIDPIAGRDDEVRQIIEILMRRRRNNPILTGEAGVGKTAVVERLAQKMAAGDVPSPLKGVTLRTLDVGLLQAGASMKGELEQRLRQVIEEVQASEAPTILFIDDAHGLLDAGAGDAANLLEPALARAALRAIAATTPAEYEKHSEQDPALMRHFQLVQVQEPSEEQAILMLRGIVSALEKHHRVQVLDEALEAAVELSQRCIPARRLPDKSVRLLDAACARVAISQRALPPEMDDCKNRIKALRIELAIIRREGAVGIDAAEREAAASAQLAEQQALYTELRARWSRERALVGQILDLHAKLRGAAGGKPAAAAAPTDPVAATDAAPAGEEREALLAQLKVLRAQLHADQGERPLVLPAVDERAVAAVVAAWTGIPLGRLVG
jgi:type VI secretion system protein VasG